MLSVIVLAKERYAINTKNWAYYRSYNYDQIKELPNVEPPLLKGKDAIHFAAKNEDLLRNLLVEQSWGGFVVKWQVNSEFDKEMNLWKVTVRLINTIPLYVCCLHVYVTGEFLSSPSCRYYK